MSIFESIAKDLTRQIFFIYQVKDGAHAPFVTRLMDFAEHRTVKNIHLHFAFSKPIDGKDVLGKVRYIEVGKDGHIRGDGCLAKLSGLSPHTGLS